MYLESLIRHLIDDIARHLVNAPPTPTAGASSSSTLHVRIVFLLSVVFVLTIAVLTIPAYVWQPHSKRSQARSATEASGGVGAIIDAHTKTV